MITIAILLLVYSYSQQNGVNVSLFRKGHKKKPLKSASMDKTEAREVTQENEE